MQFVLDFNIVKRFFRTIAKFRTRSPSICFVNTIFLLALVELALIFVEGFSLYWSSFFGDFSL